MDGLAGQKMVRLQVQPDRQNDWRESRSCLFRRDRENRVVSRVHRVWQRLSSKNERNGHAGLFQIEIQQGIDDSIIYPHLKMQVRAGAVPGISGQTKRLSLGDGLANFNIRFGQMPIPDDHAIATVYIDADAVAAIPAGLDDGSGSAALDGSAGWDGEVDAIVRPAPARTDIGSDDIIIDGTHIVRTHLRADMHFAGNRGREDVGVDDCLGHGTTVQVSDQSSCLFCSGGAFLRDDDFIFIERIIVDGMAGTGIGNKFGDTLLKDTGQAGFFLMRTDGCQCMCLTYQADEQTASNNHRG